MLRSIVNAVHSVDKDQVVDDLKTLDQLKINTLAMERFRSALIGIFAGVALLLSAIGLYGVISYSVLQRTREIGIRKALGAGRGSILRLVLRGAMIVTGIGLVAGIAGALGLAQVLASLLFNVAKYDLATIAIVAGAILLVALLACIIPAMRAAKVSPVIALKYE